MKNNKEVEKILLSVIDKIPKEDVEEYKKLNSKQKLYYLRSGKIPKIKNFALFI